MPCASNPTPSPCSRQTALRSATAALVGVSGLLGIQFQATTASAEMICAERAEIISELARNYDEKHTALGLSSSGSLIELLVSPNGGWTLLLTDPNNRTCLLESGEHWESLPVLATESAA